MVTKAHTKSRFPHPYPNWKADLQKRLQTLDAESANEDDEDRSHMSEPADTIVPKLIGMNLLRNSEENSSSQK